MLVMTTQNIIYNYIMVYISVQCHLEMTLLPAVLELHNSLTPTSPLPHIIDFCSGLHCVPPKFIRWRPNPQHFRKWLYLEMVPLKKWLIKGGYRGGPYSKHYRDITGACAQWHDHVGTQPQRAADIHKPKKKVWSRCFPYMPQKKPNLQRPWSER